MKTALIFGASRGIGAAIAKEFAKNNYFVVINYYKSEQSALNLVDEIKSSNGHALAIKADIANYEDVSNLVDSVKKIRPTIDVLVVSSGIAKNSLLIDATSSDIQNIISTNLIGTINACKKVSETMLSQHFGKIITISSMWGQVGASCETIYSASKGGIIAFTKALAKEIGYNNINVNCIAPGLIDTQMNCNLTDEDKKELIEATPSFRIGTCQDIAKAALWLASDDASYINGHVLSINGGFIV